MTHNFMGLLHSYLPYQCTKSSQKHVYVSHCLCELWVTLFLYIFWVLVVVEVMCHISFPQCFSHSPSRCLYICTVICLFTCEMCVHVFPHVLYALSACSQLIKTQCQLSCFLPAWLPGVCSSRQQPALPPPSLLATLRPLSSNLPSDFFCLSPQLTPQCLLLCLPY